MTFESMESLKTTSLLLETLDSEDVAFLESVATEVVFPEGTVIFEADQDADQFYLIAEGKAGLEVVLEDQPPILLEAIGTGEILGLSWLSYPYKWNWRAKALTTSTLVAFDAAKVRARIGENDRFAAHLSLTIAVESQRRLHAARVRLLDVYRAAATE